MREKTCDTCGKPATNAAQDIWRHEVVGEVWVQYSRCGAIKYGCDEHPAESVEYLTHLPPVRVEQGA